MKLKSTQKTQDNLCSNSHQKLDKWSKLEKLNKNRLQPNLHKLKTATQIYPIYMCENLMWNRLIFLSIFLLYQRQKLF